MIEITNKVRVFILLFAVDMIKNLALLLVFNISVFNQTTLMITAVFSLADVLVIQRFIKNG